MKPFNPLSRLKNPWVSALAGGTMALLAFGFGQSFEISKNLEIFSTLMRELDTYYVDPISPGTLTESAIESMLESLDPYTTFIPESEIENHRMSTTGQYGGIGAVVRKFGRYITIVEPYEDTPAQTAGMQPGDKMVKVNGTSVIDLNTDDVVKLLRGAPGTTAQIELIRPGEEKPVLVNVVRQEIRMKNVAYSGMLNSKTGFIKLTGFTPNAGVDVRNAMQELKKSNPELNAMVLDLRGNPGGLLREAISVVNNFVPRGELVVTTKGKVTEWNKAYRTLGDALDADIKLAVLVDRRSASASEIVSGTIQDLDRGVIIGQRTFGKGLVQSTRTLVYNTQLKVTTSKYYIPSGRCIQALDYSNRDASGKVKTIPDSLRNAFKTKLGRQVKDGAGVQPDLPLPSPKMSKILVALVQKDLIFEFANLFYRQNPRLTDTANFKIEPSTYAQFMEFLKDKEYGYETESEKALATFKETAVRERYFDRINEEYEQLLNKKKSVKRKDLSMFQNEISRYLRMEIVSRYGYRRARIRSSLLDDPIVLQAIEILQDEKRYRSILSPGFKIPDALEADQSTEEDELLPENE
ncbi:MAG: S41 family peptidase [Bacteroidetes bacterium]|nr:S41 family peptidase [Bacteroidota bacterium]